MKRLLFIAIVALGVSFSACKKNDSILPSDESAMATPSSSDKDAPSQQSGSQVNPKSLLTEFMVSPQFGKPNSTYYYFRVYDPTGTSALSVKLYERATGVTTYRPMSKIGGYWTLSTTIAINGWYDWRYVYTAGQSAISGTAYVLCNSNNFLSSSATCSITWPFGADGSNWNNRNGYANGSYQIWRGGQESKGTSYHIGYGWQEGTHTGTDEQYSDDWNRGNGSEDRYSEIRSPLDGYIDDISSYYVPSLGTYSKYVAIVQTTATGKIYRFYVAHLETAESSLYVGKYVRAGVTKIGTLGMSGASSPHAHTSLRDVTNNSRISLPFVFNAQ